jgi:hypothetical protein
MTDPYSDAALPSGKRAERAPDGPRGRQKKKTTPAVASQEDWLKDPNVTRWLDGDFKFVREGEDIHNDTDAATKEKIPSGRGKLPGSDKTGTKTYK